jgi:hypothetical protein
MTIQPGIYRHFKGKNYEVIGIAHHSETLEELVVYRALYSSPDFGENALWVRPVKIWEQEVEFEGRKFKRFEKV